MDDGIDAVVRLVGGGVFFAILDTPGDDQEKVKGGKKFVTEVKGDEHCSYKFKRGKGFVVISTPFFSFKKVV